jgi:two-component system, chemotaxis family, response regulator Rcp1
MRPIDILLVEDNPGDVRLTQEALRESRILNELSVVGDGAAAIAFLEREGSYADAPVPDLILLDLNLPKLSGREVLERIKSHEQWKVIPVVMLTTSDSERDVIESYAHHVNCYITKPLAFEPFMEVIKRIEDFWLTIVRLPKAS